MNVTVPKVADRFLVRLGIDKPEEEKESTIPIKVYLFDNFSTANTDPRQYIKELMGSQEGVEVKIGGKTFVQRIYDALASGADYRYGILFLYGRQGKPCADLLLYRGKWEESMVGDAFNFIGRSFTPATSGVFCETEAVIAGLEALLRLERNTVEAYIADAPKLPTGFMAGIHPRGTLNEAISKTM